MERLRGHRDSVYSVAFTPDARGLVSGSLDKTLKYWDVARLAGGPGGRPNSPGASKRDGLNGEKKIGGNSACTMNFAGHKVGVEWGGLRQSSNGLGTGLRFICRCLARWSMGCERIERPWSSILGCEECGCPIDVARSQELRSVNAVRSDPVRTFRG